MKQLNFLVRVFAIISLKCTDTTKGDFKNSENIIRTDSVYKELSVDNVKIARLLNNNKEFFGFYPDNDHNEDSDTIEQKTESDLYKVIGYKECNDYQHWTIFKTRDLKGLDLHPYKGIYFIITDREQNGLARLLLAEDSFVIFITSVKDSIVSAISSDLVTTKSFSHSCSDVVDDDGEMRCWTKVKTTINRISCDRIIEVDSDTDETSD